MPDETIDAAPRAVAAIVDQIETRLPPDGPSIIEAPLESTGAFGRYEGVPPQLELEDDGRNATVLAPITYFGPEGMEWPVPTGAVCDGASIPQAFWTIIGGPFEGKYRNASIVHDRYCVTKSRPWRVTHLMFWQAMRCSGVGAARAAVMYYAVRRFGPRWPDPGLEGFAAQPVLSTDGLAADADRIIDENLDPSAIDQLVEKREG